MNKDSAKVDAYIAKSAPFAQPILRKLRRLFHEACPSIQEAIKWGVPYFEYTGLVGGMAAFQRHVSLGFWNYRSMSDPYGLLGRGGEYWMLKFRHISELPADNVLLAYINEAVQLNEIGAKRSSPHPRDPKRGIDLPDDLASALREDKKAFSTFQGFSYSHRKEYVEWLAEAKREATRQKRLATAIEWLAEGKPLYWRYETRRS
jgi:uncharacterized protein YdeI (YjbR/CyaY-like superfamily)